MGSIGVFLVASYFSKAYYTVTEVTPVQSVQTCKVMERVLWNDVPLVEEFSHTTKPPARTMCIEVKEDGTRIIHTDVRSKSIR